ncbi:uncharacterized [Tachysurus ichikawai]
MIFELQSPHPSFRTRTWRGKGQSCEWKGRRADVKRKKSVLSWRGTARIQGRRIGAGLHQSAVDYNGLIFCSGSLSTAQGLLLRTLSTFRDIYGSRPDQLIALLLS